MRGKHNQQEDFMTLVSLESLVPSDHIVRLMEEHIDFSFIDKRTEGLYSTKGRPSVAPQVLIRMMLILPNRRMCLAQKCLNTAKITLNTMKAMTS